ncbi:LysR substrate-binding domain-containing protein [Tsukamurella soli]|uniref:LysR family transcriptional regulator n=1 Tax=Tsukamurella soli TaxID=644556 RepID=A0ABP8KH90_9ACTN
MEIRWLEAFVAVAEELHFGRAAARLQMAQSPLSQTIRKLEKEVGEPLFDRNTRSVSLTAAGAGLLPHAYRVLEEVDSARLAVRAAGGGVYGRITIGFSGVLNHRSLPPLTRAVRQRYPDIELALVGRVLTRDAVTQLTSGALDLALVGLPVDVSTLRSRLIAREAYGAVLPEDDPRARATRLDLRELADDGFITAPQTQGSALQETTVQACLNAGFRPRIVQETTDPYMILLLVAAGVGVALMTGSMAEVLPPGAVFVPLTDETPYMLHGLAWSPARTTPALRAVLEVADAVLPTPTD